MVTAAGPRPPIELWICLLFFLSGFSALVYEIAWTRQLGLTLGNTAQATSCVLAVFLGGLSVGAALGGRLADRIERRHLLAYGVCETAIAVVAPAVTFALVPLQSLFLHLNRLDPSGPVWIVACRIIAAAAMLMVPTILMGATLPLLIKMFAGRGSRSAHIFSLLYGINTLGAVAGSLLSCFVGFAFLGITSTIFAAASINGLVGLVACFFGSRRQAPAQAQTATAVEQPPPENTTDKTTDKTPEKTPDFDRTLAALCLVAALSGFTALGYEVLWTRLIKFYILPDTYAFTAMVATFLLGLALGSFIYDRLLRAELNFCNQLNGFALVQFAVALSCGASLLFIPCAILIRTGWLPGLTASIGASAANLAIQLGVSGLFMLLPATVLGIAFPLLGSLAAARPQAVGTAVGLVYAANTVGCVAGSLVVGLLLIPACGSYEAFKWVVATTLATGAIAVVVSGRPLRDARVAALLALAAGLFVAASTTLKDPYAAELGKPRGGQTLSRLAEDATGIVMVFTYPDYAQLVINGQPYASTILKGRRYMRLLGHLPMLLHRCPSDVLNICFGTGTTAGAIALHPELRRLDVVDLSPAVVDSARYFAATNYGVAGNPKVKFHIDDGRNFLLRSANLYDVVSFEPPPPREVGVVNLYSTDFYLLVKAHLKPGGLLCQWIPLDGESAGLWRMMIASARAVFPFVSVWEPNDGQALLIASREPHLLNLEELSRRIGRSDQRDDRLRASLDEVGLADPYAIAATYVSSGARLDRQIARSETITDDRPRLEFFYPYDGPRLYPADLLPMVGRSEEIFDAAGADGGGWIDRGALSRNREAMRLLRLANTADERDHDRLEARSLAARALTLSPTNRYLKHLMDVYPPTAGPQGAR